MERVSFPIIPYNITLEHTTTMNINIIEASSSDEESVEVVIPPPVQNTIITSRTDEFGRHIGAARKSPASPRFSAHTTDAFSYNPDTRSMYFIIRGLPHPKRDINVFCGGCLGHARSNSGPAVEFSDVVRKLFLNKIGYIPEAYEGALSFKGKFFFPPSSNSRFKRNFCTSLSHSVINSLQEVFNHRENNFKFVLSTKRESDSFGGQGYCKIRISPCSF